MTLAVLILSLSGTAAGLQIPDAFDCAEFSSRKLADDIQAIAIDPKGRIFVGGRGYLRALVDDDNDGRADRALDFAIGPASGAMGLCWDGDALYVVGDGAVLRYLDKDHNDQADGPPETLAKFQSTGEHGPHAIHRGPEAWFYVMAGNESAVTSKYATSPRSPVREPVAGCLLRFSPDWKRCEIIADGFRNACDFDFNPAGEIFTYDSDNERCVSLPWYEPTRFYHVVEGGHYGWQGPTRLQTWRMPPYFPDVVPPVATLQRGSPTGVACYRHVQFPEDYRGGFFALDWTFGRVWFLPLKPEGASYSTVPELFLEATGGNGFAPTGVVVHPDTGDLYVSIGGRGTRGAVYRIRYVDGFREMYDPRAIASLQPHSKDLDQLPTFELPRLSDANLESDKRLQLETMARFPEVFSTTSSSANASVWMDDEDRLVRQAAARLRASRRAMADKTPNEDLVDVALGLAPISLAHLAEAGLTNDRILVLLGRHLDGFLASENQQVRLSFVRAAEKLIGDIGSPSHRADVWAGYSIRTPTDYVQRLPEQIWSAFPTGQANVDRELSRLAAMVELKDAQFTRKVVGQLTDASDPAEDIHYLIVLSRLKGNWDDATTRTVADAMLKLEGKLLAGRHNRDRNWPLRMEELHRALAKAHPALNEALISSSHFGAEGHLLWTNCPGFDRQRAARTFFSRATADPNWIWTSEFVKLASELPVDVVADTLREHWNDYGLRDEIGQFLTTHPDPRDRTRLLDWLASAEGNDLEMATSALEAIGVDADEKAARNLWKAIQRLKNEDPLRLRLAKLLAQTLGEPPLTIDIEGWLASIEDRAPPFLKDDSTAVQRSIAEQKARYSRIGWSEGDTIRGRAVYNRLGCRQCHSGALAAGPDLAGVAYRFSQQDLWTAIVDPHREVADRYHATTILTRSGKTYFGIVAYEAVDSCILLLRDGQTVRIDPAEIEERQGEPKSLMPEGLLDPISDKDVADLMAYIRSLGQSMGDG